MASSCTNLSRKGAEKKIVLVTATPSMNSYPPSAFKDELLMGWMLPFYSISVSVIEDVGNPWKIKYPSSSCGQDTVVIRSTGDFYLVKKE